MTRALCKRFGPTLLLAFAAAAAPGSRLAGQAAEGTAACEGLSVDSVKVETSRPAFGGAAGWWRKVARAVGLHHQTTAPGLVRRFVSLDPGLACTEFRRSESERILRAQPFLADAIVATTRIGDSVRVAISTVDEVPVVAGTRLRGTNIQALNVGTMNFLGAGMHIEGRWEDGRANRDGFGGKLAHNQLFGRPYSIVAEGGQRPMGEFIVAGLHHRFHTDLQRIAWHTGFSVSKDFARLRRPDRTELLQPVDRSVWNGGGVLRFGPPRKLWLIGGTVLGERLVPRHEFFLADTLTGLSIPTTDTVGVRRYETYDATSVAGVFGRRALIYSRMRGLDVLAAEQDVAAGVQVGTMLGVQPWARVPLRESFASIDAYAGTRWRRSLLGVRIEAESRLDLEKAEWQHLIASGRGAWYIRPAERWVSELSVEAAGGWRTIVPFQIELGDRHSGVRGYAHSHEVGSQRVLARLEQRFDVARYRGSHAAFGVAAFADGGRMWAGDVPYGIATAARISVGAAVLAAVPAHSQRTIRAELALPLSRAEGARPEMRFSVREPLKGFWFEPARIRWARLSPVPDQIFTWP